MKVFVVIEIEPEHAYPRTVIAVFEMREKAEAFISQELSQLAAGFLGGFPTEKNRQDVWWEIEEFILQ